MASNRANAELIFEISSPGRKAYSLPACDIPETGAGASKRGEVKCKDAADSQGIGKAAYGMIPGEFVRKTDAGLPEVSEVDVARHFTMLARRNHGVDSGFYPLGSCTMKYNPKINEDIANLDGFAGVHPYQQEETVQGCLRILYEMDKMLSEITGMERFSLQPAAGAHGELTGLMIIAAYHKNRGDERRTKIIIPDSAHGTNPASAVLAGFETVEVKSDERGGVDIEALKLAAGDDTAGLMLTNPNTLGLFDENIKEIATIVHNAGGLLYYDGANANAILGVCRPGDMGFDVVHLNLHKTFGTPHGGGGPGAGPVGVKKELVPFLPVPSVEKDNGIYRLNYNHPKSIGRVKSFYGNFGVILKAYAYIRTMGPDGLRQVAENAVLNANYLMNRIKGVFDLPYERSCMHEFVVSGQRQAARGVRTLDIAKRLIDFGYHPPTVYFPLIVHEAMMIEPTETESKETLDRFADTLAAIAAEAEQEPDTVRNAPHTTVVSRPDEVKAARTPVLKWEG